MLLHAADPDRLGRGIDRSGRGIDRPIDDDHPHPCSDAPIERLSRADRTPPPLKAIKSHTDNTTILLSIIIIAVIIILLSMSLLFVHTQACGNRIPIVGFVSCSKQRNSEFV